MSIYLDHFGLTEAPFRITPHTDFFFDGANRGATLEALLYAITHDEGIVKVTGEVGTGKTMLCRVLMERLPENVTTVYLANPSLEPDALLRAIATDIGLPASKSQDSHGLTMLLQEYLVRLYAAGKRVVVLIDEAHAMPQESLEEVRLLSNIESSRHKLLQLVLFGQPELDEILTLNAMRPLRERITQIFRLEALRLSDISAYVNFRLKQAGQRGRSLFDEGALKLLAQHSEGLTRRVNILADKSLLAAFADGRDHVEIKHAKAAVVDANFVSISPQPWFARLTGRQSRLPIAPGWVVLVSALVLALVLAIGVAAGFWLVEPLMAGFGIKR